MSIQIIQREQCWFPVPVQGVYQFWFPDEVWELIKEFLITHRSMLLHKMKKMGLSPMCNIYEKYFHSKLSRVNSRRIELEDKKKQIKGCIIERCDEDPTKYAEIMENEFQVKPKKPRAEKNYDWLQDFAVGEEVVVRKIENKSLVCHLRKNVKGVVRKIGKTIQVELYQYRWIEGKYTVLETFGEKVNVYRRDNIFHSQFVYL
jgi:hypothetical protein